MSRENVDFEAIRNRIKAVRKDAELSQEAFGKPIGLRRQDVNAIESGNRNPGLTVLYRIVNEYELTFDWLLLGE